jgi:hypothetical protein
MFPFLSRDSEERVSKTMDSYGLWPAFVNFLAIRMYESLFLKIPTPHEAAIGLVRGKVLGDGKTLLDLSHDRSRSVLVWGSAHTRGAVVGILSSAFDRVMASHRRSGCG